MKYLFFTLFLLISTSKALYRWKNDMIESIRSNNPRVGHPLILGVRHREEYSRASCSWRSPNYEIEYTVQDGVVLDGNGDVVDGVEAWDDGGDASVCGIRIESLEEAQDEDSEDLYSVGWECELHFLEGLHGQEELKWLSVEIHLRDENHLKPELQDYLGFKPLHYNLSLTPELLQNNQTITFSASVTVDLLVEEYPGFIIPINMFAIDIRKLGGVIKRQNSSNVEEPWVFERVIYNLQEDLIIFFGKNPTLSPGDEVTLEIDYDANVNFNVMNGYGIWKEPCTNVQDPEAKQCWFTQFEAVGARQLLPCFDEPRAKASFDVRVARTEGWSTLFNTPLLTTEPHPDREGWVWDVFETTPVMSTYTMALAIQDFASKPTSSSNMTIWAQEPYVSNGFADYPAEIGPKCVSALEYLTGVPYSLDKMDMVNVNSFGGAMENWGLILYEFAYLLYDPSIPDPDFDRKYDVLETVAHELVHQWFGNLVTMAWWDQLWLNEGFATWLSIVVSDIVDPEIHAFDRFVAQQMFYVMKVDSRPHAWALSDQVTSIDDIDRKFGLITYYKGGAVLRMIEFFLGTETVKKGLNRYLLDLSFSSAVEEDLFIHLEAAALEDGSWPQPGVSDLTEVLKTWTQQSGLPLVTVTRSADGAVTIRQTRYQNTETPSDQVWSIPVTMVDLGSLSRGDIDWDDTKPDLWLTEASAEVSLAIPLLNKKATGYYRVTYDEDLWREIAAILDFDHESIHPYNRAQIICDTAHLAAHGYMDPALAAEVTSWYQDTEEEFVVVRAYNECVHNMEVERMPRRI